MEHYGSTDNNQAVEATESRARFCESVDFLLETMMKDDLFKIDIDGARDDGCDRSTAIFQRKLRNELGLIAVSKNDVGRVLRKGGTVSTICKNMKDLIESAWDQQCRAERVFEMLDETGKQVVVVEDLERVADEFLRQDGDVSSQELFDMINFANSSGLVTKKDFCRLARKINL